MSHKIENIVLADRKLYSVFNLQIPRLTGKKLKEAIRYKLVTIFPDDISRFDFDFKRNGKEKNSYLVFVLPEILSKNVVYLSTLIILNHVRVNSGWVLFIYMDWIEVCVVKNGSLVSTYVKKIVFASFSDEINSIIRESPEPPFIVCSKDKIHYLSDCPSIDKSKIFDLDDIYVSLDRDAVFIRKCAEFKRRKILFVIVTGIFVCVLGNYGVRYQASLRKQSIEQEQIKNEMKLYLKHQAELQVQRKALMDELDGLISKRKASPFDVMRSVSLCLDAKTQIFSATFRSGFFQFESGTGDALKILRSFEENPLIMNISMQSISSKNGVEKISMSGSVALGYLAHVPNSNILEEIDILKNLIDEEKKKNEYYQYKNKASYASGVKYLLEKNNCVINQYKFIQTENGDEVEYSIAAANKNIVSFLKSATCDANRFEVTLIQIKNLTPVDVLDVTVRFRLSISEDEKKEVGLENDVLNFNIADISKNYYAEIDRNHSTKTDQPENKKIAVKLDKPKQVLEYVGVVAAANGEQYVYAKNQSGDVVQFCLGRQGNMSCKILSPDLYEGIINSEFCEIRRNN